MYIKKFKCMYKYSNLCTTITITFDVSCMCQIKVPAQTKKVVLNVRVQQDLHQVLSEYVRILMNASKTMSCVRLDAITLLVRFDCYRTNLFRDAF